MLRRLRRSPNMSLHTHVCFTTSSTPDRSQNGTTKRGLFFWMERSASRRVRRLRQFGAVRRRGRILLPAWRSPHPHSAGSPLRPPGSRVRRQRRSPQTPSPLLLSPVSSKSTRPASGPSSIRGRCAADKSPLDTASATLAFDGTRLKSGSQSDREAVTP